MITQSRFPVVEIHWKAA